MTAQIAYYPHENNGTFISLETLTTPPPRTTADARYALDFMLDRMHLFAPPDADFLDYYHCWLQAGGPDLEWMRRRTLDLYNHAFARSQQ